MQTGKQTDDELYSLLFRETKNRKSHKSLRDFPAETISVSERYGPILY